MVDFIKKNKILVGLAFFVVAVLYVFFPVLGKYSALYAPDSMPFFAYKYRSVVWANVLGGQTAFTPYTLYWLIFNPLYAHELTYIIDTLVLTLGALYYLRGRGVSPLAAWCGALALGFSGYTFTLFCAGHRGYFHMFSCAVWAFGLIDRGFSKKKLIYFALTGLVFAWGIPYQPDVLVFVASTAALYAFWLTFKQSTSFLKTALSVWPRFLVMLVFLVMAGYNAIHSAVTDRIADRKAQIAGVSRSSQSKAGDSKNKAEPKVSPEEQWLFATNWSLPPEDMLEFIVPGVFGNESFHGDHPYWGRLGRPHKSVFQKGRMMPNYRQHTVYFGVVAFIFSLFAIVAWFNIRKLPEEEADEKTVFRDVPFWAGIWLICLILAMGRFTPLYRLFYSIPYMDLIRAPVKFLHLVEVASALLCGFGVHALISGYREKKFGKSLLWITAGVAVVLVVSALFFMAGQSSITAHVKSLGTIKNAGGVFSYALSNIGRSFLFLIPVAAAAWLLLKKGGRFLVIFGYALVFFVAFDHALVARRYVKAMNIAPLYKENAVVKALKKDAQGTVPRVLNYAPREQSNDWFRKSLGFNGIVSLEPGPKDGGNAYAGLFTSLQKNPVRLWQVLNVKYLILPYNSAGQLVRSGVAQPLLAFDLGAGTVRQSSQPGEKTLALLSLKAAKSKPRLFTAWQGGIPVEDQLKQLPQSKLIVSDAEQAVGAVQLGSSGSLEVLFEQAIPAAYSIGVKTKAPSEALLVFNQRVNGKYEILVDGTAVESYMADCVWMAAKVPAGEHEVVLRRKKAPLQFVLSLSSMLFIAGWGILRLVKKEPVDDM